MRMPVIVGLAVIAYAVYCALRGSVRIRTSKYRHPIIYREENPGCFWSVVVMQGLVGAAMIVVFWMNYRRR
jgi:uncharacterized membrane protein YfcA